MKNVFSEKGGNLEIAKRYTFPKGKAPKWFANWHMAALSASEANEWQLTTGVIKLLNGTASVMEPDGVSIVEVSANPNIGWSPSTEISTDDSNAGGLTVPTEAMQRDLGAMKDKEMHYKSAIVKPDSSVSNQRGVMVIVDRLEDQGQTLPRNAQEMTMTLFHELYHAGQVSQGRPYRHRDDRFEKLVGPIELFFQSC